MLRLRVLICALLACAVTSAGAMGVAAPALASHSQVTYFEAPEVLLNPVTRPTALQQMQWLGVTALRLELTWGYVAPDADSATKPEFDAKNPASYAWGQYDAVLAEAKRLKWQVLLTVSSPVPRWATSNKQEPYVTNPDDRDFEEFMTAVARHYGSEVSLFAIWNEPNQPAFLRPQFNSKGVAEAPRLYRGLFEAGYKGLQEGGISKPKVLMGEAQPTAKFFSNPKQGLLYDAVSPIAFLRGALCLNAQYRKAPTCSSLPAYGFSIHPYTIASSPYSAPSNLEDVTIGSLGRLVTALNKAGKSGAVKAGLPLYVTEFGIRSVPEKAIGVPLSTQAEWDAISERLAWENPRVASFSQYLLRDDVLHRGPQTGLEKINGAKKPLYYGFPVPLTVTSTSHGYNLWGFVRPAKKVTTVTVLVQRPHSHSYQVLRNVKTGPGGYWTLSSNVRGSWWRVRWTSPSGVKYEGPPVHAYAAP
jgi:Cellulase (glycosyl hydrolase family 5)